MPKPIASWLAELYDGTLLQVSVLESGLVCVQEGIAGNAPAFLGNALICEKGDLPALDTYLVLGVRHDSYAEEKITNSKRWGPVVVFCRHDDPRVRSRLSDAEHVVDFVRSANIP